MTIDLTNNKIPLGLLSPREQLRLMKWEHGVEIWDSASDLWKPYESNRNLICDDEVCRTVPAPKRREWWDVIDRHGRAFSWWSLIAARRDAKQFGGTVLHITIDEDMQNPKIEVVE